MHEETAVSGGGPKYAKESGRNKHVIVAEKALGKPLPTGAQVHHVDGDGMNYSNANLVICEDNAYHKLLHSRQRALRECGNPDFRRCWACKTWDDPANLIIAAYRSGHGESVTHWECRRRDAASRASARRTQRDK